MRRIFSELVPLRELEQTPVLSELAARRIQLLCALWPGDDPSELLARARDLDLSIGLWPLLPDADGRWLSRHNAARFERHALDIAERYPAHAIVIDVEPPIAEVRRVLRGDLRALRSAAFAQDARTVPRLVDRLVAAVPEVIVAVPPPVVAQGPAALAWERAFGIAALDSRPTICAMLYSSLFEGYSQGGLRRRDAMALLGTWSRAALQRYGDRACIGLGCVGRGALGDERPYRGATELAQDVAIARGVGAADLAIFDLSGILERAPSSTWLRAICESEETMSPAPTLRSRATAELARWAGALGRWAR